jgi:hypothetical protein
MSRFVGTIVVSLLLAACRGTTGPEGGILSYDGSASIKSEAPIVVAGVVTVRNTSSSIVTIERNSCPFELSLHNYVSSNSAPAWRSEPAVCLGYSSPLDLAPGNSYAFEVQASLPSNLKDGLYYLTVVNSQWNNGDPIILGNVEIANGKARK